MAVTASTQPITTKPAGYLRLALLLALPILSLALTPTASAELPIANGSQGLTTVSVRDELPDWHYKLRPGETFQEAAKDLLTSGHTSLQLAAYNKISNITHVKAGDALRIPLGWLKRQPEPATVVAITGQGQVRLANSGYREPIRAQMRLRVGDEVTTQAGSVTVMLADGSIIRINQNSRLVFNRLTQFGRTGMVDTRLRLERGELSTDVKPLIEKGSRFEIETSSAVAAVRGTSFSLQTEPGMTRLQVREGAVAFGTRGKTQIIPAGYSASVGESGRTNVDIRRLLPTPNAGKLPANIQKLPIDVNWAVNGATRHQLEIFDAETGHQVARSQTSDRKFSLNYLDNGRYEVQVASLSNGGIAGMPNTQFIDVDLQARAARPLLPIIDALVDDDLPEFKWEYRGENEVGRVEIAESENFGDLIATSEWAPDNTALPSRPLSPGKYYWRVVTEAGGNSVATSDTQAFMVNGTLPPVKIININYIDSQVRVFWQSVATANDYLLQLSEDPNFENIVKEATVADTTAALRLIPGRRYFVRLKVLSDSPLASRWGPGRELFIE
ncbi:FecR family protein [Marinobacter caseinilyticus]|uniref:FecR family protein n=1 Tax=Marinobacter caseinilyticus TaxID=2692195 RepID=UPI00140AA291|nr:FecR domain-containing protein [Marinobacter caseinilyticus]